MVTITPPDPKPLEGTDSDIPLQSELDDKMHELFLSTSVANDDLERALKILQGFSGMKPVTLIRRRLIWEGPRVRNLKGIDPAFIRRQPPLKQQLWQALHEQLVRQSFVISLVYDIDRSHFGQTENSAGENSSEGSKKEEQVLSCDQLPGTLRWTDLPDPAGARPVNSRLLVSIENETSLCTVLKSMNHRFVRELIEECHRFVLGNVLFEFSRYLTLPPSEMEPISAIRSRLPPYESLIPFDAEGKWIFIASAAVFNGNSPEYMQKGIDELMTVKEDFEGCFDLQAMDRHTFDTRVKF